MPLIVIQTKILKLCQLIKLIPNDLVSLSHLDYQIPIEKHLDEYRELIDEIESQTQFFSNKRTHWSMNHARTHDDFLLHLSEIKTPSHQKVGLYRARPRPRALP